MSLTDEQRALLNERLENQRNTLLRTTLSNQVDLETRGDEYDMATQLEMLERWERLASRDVALYQTIHATMQRMSSEDFGFCDDCGEEIQFERLLVRPTATMCILCQEDREFARGRRRHPRKRRAARPAAV